MARQWPAIEVRGSLSDADADLLLAAIDDFSPTALEKDESGLRIFFAIAEARDAAIAAIAHLATPGASGYATIDVSDEDWAERSQDNLQPVTVGRITIVPSLTGHSSIVDRQSSISLVIPPSMAFGTGHHATTRLCLAALQTIDVAGRSVIDVGAGSGVLAFAAAALGARRVVGIDNDLEAVATARENLARNPHVRNVEFFQRNLRELAMSDADILTANLTGHLLASESVTLTNSVRPGGHLIISGVLAEESDAVLGAFGLGVHQAWLAEEDGWIGVRLVKK